MSIFDRIMRGKSYSYLFRTRSEQIRIRQCFASRIARCRIVYAFIRPQQQVLRAVLNSYHYSFFLLRLLLCVFLLAFQTGTSADISAAELTDRSKQTLHVTVLDVGQGLAVILQCGDQFVLYDGGPGSASSKVVAALRNAGAGKLSYVIASHYDEDHLNGIFGALYAFPVEHLLAPDYETDTAIYQSFLKAVDAASVNITHPKAGDTFSFSGATISILMPVSDDYQNENDRSIVARITCGKNSVFLTGDCTVTGEYEMLLSNETLESDILVAGHHGSAGSTSQAFLEAVSPDFAIISCGQDNTYGHPSKEVMERLKENRIKLFRTDKQGDIVLQSDGDSWYCNQEPTNDYSYRLPEYQADNDTVFADDNNQIITPDQTGEYTYVLNTNSHKFHYTSCPSADDISPRNRAYSNASRDKIIMMGYDPCKRCRP